jgi:hypothetical protein
MKPPYRPRDLGDGSVDLRASLIAMQPRGRPLDKPEPEEA